MLTPKMINYITIRKLQLFIKYSFFFNYRTVKHFINTQFVNQSDYYMKQTKMLCINKI